MKMIDEGTKVGITLTYNEAETITADLLVLLAFAEVGHSTIDIKPSAALVKLKDKLDEYCNT